MLAWNYVVALCMVCFIVGFFVCGAAVYHIDKCDHEYEKIYDGCHKIVYRCKKCGKVQKVRIN